MVLPPAADIYFMNIDLLFLFQSQEEVSRLHILSALGEIWRRVVLYGSFLDDPMANNIFYVKKYQEMPGN